MTLQRVPAGDSIGRGILFPLRRTNADFENGTGQTLIESNVRKVLGVDGATEDNVIMGEYPWRLEFGSWIQRLRHGNIRDVEEDLSVVLAARAVQRWEPRATVLTDRSFVDRPKTGERIRRLRILFILEDDVVGSGVQRQDQGTEVEVAL